MADINKKVNFKVDVETDTKEIKKLDKELSQLDKKIESLSENIEETFSNLSKSLFNAFNQSIDKTGKSLNKTLGNFERSINKINKAKSGLELNRREIEVKQHSLKINRTDAKSGVDLENIEDIYSILSDENNIFLGTRSKKWKKLNEKYFGLINNDNYKDVDNLKTIVARINDVLSDPKHYSENKGSDDLYEAVVKFRNDVLIATNKLNASTLNSINSLKTELKKEIVSFNSSLNNIRNIYNSRVNYSDMLSAKEDNEINETNSELSTYRSQYTDLLNSRKGIFNDMNKYQAFADEGKMSLEEYLKATNRQDEYNVLTSKLSENDKLIVDNKSKTAESENKLLSLTKVKSKKDFIASLSKSKSIGQFASQLGNFAVKKVGATAAGGAILGKAAAIANPVGLVVAAVGLVVKAVVSGFNKTVKQFTGMDVSLKGIWNGVLNAVSAITSLRSGMATYDTANSLISNSTARNNQLKYGLTSQANYAMTQAMALLGMSGLDDLVYMNSNQQSAFQEYYKMYSSWYNELMSSGTLQTIQKAQISFELYKQQIAVAFLNWFASHKDTVFSIIRAIMQVIVGILKLVNGIYQWTHWGKSLMSDSDFDNLEKLISDVGTSSSAVAQNTSSSTVTYVVNNNNQTYNSSQNNSLSTQLDENKLIRVLENYNTDQARRIAASTVTDY